MTSGTVKYKFTLEYKLPESYQVRSSNWQANLKVLSEISNLFGMYLNCLYVT